MEKFHGKVYLQRNKSDLHCNDICQGLCTFFYERNELDDRMVTSALLRHHQDHHHNHLLRIALSLLVMDFDRGEQLLYPSLLGVQSE